MGKRIILAASLFNGSGGTNTGGTNTGGGSNTGGGTNTGGGSTNTDPDPDPDVNPPGGNNEEEEVYTPDPSITSYGSCVNSGTATLSLPGGDSGSHAIFVFPADISTLRGKVVKRIKLATADAGSIQTVSVKGIVDAAVTDSFGYFDASSNITEVETINIPSAGVHDITLSEPITITPQSRFGIKWTYNTLARLCYRTADPYKLYNIKPLEDQIRFMNINLNVQLLFE